MSQPDHEAIVDEIRSARITASPELRARVRELATAVPPAPRRRELRRPRPVLALAAAAAAVTAATAVAVGVVTSGGDGQRDAVRREAVLPTPLATTDQGVASGGIAPKAAGGGASGSLPATPGRAQLYESELTLKVKDLSDATKRALGLTRSFHGYVRTVEYGSGSERGSAYLTLRVPVGSVQAAIVELSALGEILDQHVSIRDVQPTLDRRFREMQATRDSIAKLQARLESPSLSAAERTTLENRLVAQRRQLVVLQRQQAALERLTSFATVELALRAADKAVVVPASPGRIERALDRAGSILLDEAKVLLYVVIVGAPFLALALLAYGAVRLRRRRDEARLLASA
jgi:hypothetical protein